MKIIIALIITSAIVLVGVAHTVGLTAAQKVWLQSYNPGTFNATPAENKAIGDAIAGQ